MDRIRFLPFLITIIVLILFCVPSTRNQSSDKIDSIEPVECRSECLKNMEKRSQECIQKVISCESENVARLYEQVLKRNQDVRGKINVKFIIHANGDTEVKGYTLNTINDTIFIKDLLKEISTWRFPESSHSSVEIVYPFMFDDDK